MDKIEQKLEEMQNLSMNTKFTVEERNEFRKKSEFIFKTILRLRKIMEYRTEQQELQEKENLIKQYTEAGIDYTT